MKRIKNLFFIAVIITAFWGCKKDDSNNQNPNPLPSGPIPVLTTLPVSHNVGLAELCGGNITSDGGLIITGRGVCWSKSQNPTISDSTTKDGTGAGVFSSNIKGLQKYTTYYVRAYATNANGTGYGSILSFTTSGEIGYLLQPGESGYDANLQHGLLMARLGGYSGLNWSNANNACNDLILDGYDDWYLPSINELQKIDINKVAIGVLGTYWSSELSSFSTNKAKCWTFNSGSIDEINIYDLLGVIAIRKF
jgi:hypothetical protein